MPTPSHPASLELQPRNHALCTCGLSRNGAFCDGSHQGTGKTPHILRLEVPKTAYLWNGGATGSSPFCDGGHSRLVAPSKPPIADVPVIAAAIAAAEAELGDRGRIVVRYSGTEQLARVMVEAESQDDVERYCTQISAVFQQELGV